MPDPTPRGIRNNNPLNIRRNPANAWQGLRFNRTDEEFEEFSSMQYGFRAAIIIIRSYLRRRLCSCLFDIIARWAPVKENNVTAYVNFVSNISGIDPRAKLTHNTDKRAIVRIVRAMAIFENGVKYAHLFPLDLISRAYDLT